MSILSRVALFLRFVNLSQRESSAGEESAGDVMRGDMVSQFVSVLELPVAHVAGELLLLVTAVHSLVPLQAVLPLVLLAAVGADVFGLHHRYVGVPGVHMSDGI